jgi:hypothetical protein
MTMVEGGTMSERTDRGGEVHAEFHGNITGPVAAVNYGTQTQNVGAIQAELTDADRAEIQRLLGELRARVAAEAPPEKQAAALERVSELEAAVTSEKPDRRAVTRMEYARDWFLDNLPALAGSVTSIVVSPIVGKLVAAAGDSLVAEFQRRFPIG